MFCVLEGERGWCLFSPNVLKPRNIRPGRPPGQYERMEKRRLGQALGPFLEREAVARLGQTAGGKMSRATHRAAPGQLQALAHG